MTRAERRRAKREQGLCADCSAPSERYHCATCRRKRAAAGRARRRRNGNQPKPYYCGLCGSAEHTRPLCPYPDEDTAFAAVAAELGS